MSKYTPGPWKVLRGPDAIRPAVTAVDPETGRVMFVCKLATLADARLIAAAPELLEALKELVNTREQHAGRVEPGSDGRYARARAAIAKAEGA